MFAIEINFNDGVSSPETLLIRRVQASIGSGNKAHVVIEGSTAKLSELNLYKGLGSRFFYQIGNTAFEMSSSETEADGTANIDLGEVNVTVTSLLTDLAVKADESLDQASIRVLAEAMGSFSGEFPALLLKSNNPVVLSFKEDSEITLGRGANVDFRIDSSDISSQHARVGYANGRFWIEDLGSTNGTFFEGERISGRVEFTSGESFKLGLDSEIVGIDSRDDVSFVEVDEDISSDAAYVPCLISLSEVVKPEKIELKPGTSFTIGRDPANDIWIGATHISRRHAVISVLEDGGIEIVDESANGTFVDKQRLESDQKTLLDSTNKIINFGGDVRISLCFSKDEEASHLGEAVEEKPEYHPEPFVSQTVQAPVVNEISGVFNRLVAEKEAEQEAEKSKVLPESIAETETEIEEIEEVEVVEAEVIDESRVDDIFFDEGHTGDLIAPSNLKLRILNMLGLLVILIAIVLGVVWIIGSSVF